MFPGKRAGTAKAPRNERGRATWLGNSSSCTGLWFRGPWERGWRVVGHLVDLAATLGRVVFGLKDLCSPGT